MVKGLGPGVRKPWFKYQLWTTDFFYVRKQTSIF